MSAGNANAVWLQKVGRILFRKADAALGRLYPLHKTLAAMELRPFELHLELTNLCNADCVFCPYQFQERKTEVMSDAIFKKAVADYVAAGGGSVGLTPVVGDALIDPSFVSRVKYLRSFPQIDRIWLTTNAILLDRHGVDEVLDLGLTAITISTAGFDEAMYARVYRNRSYHRMRQNVLKLLERNAARRNPIPVAIALRPDRALKEVMQDPDFQSILAYRPQLDFAWSYATANGRIRRESLPPLMKIRTVSQVKKESCVQLYNGPIVLSNGTVLACSCVASMDAEQDLGIGNILESNLLDLWRSDRLRQLRESFRDGRMNPTCSGCDMYRDLELYQTSEGRERARINLARNRGLVTIRKTSPRGPFAGG